MSHIVSFEESNQGSPAKFVKPFRLRQEPSREVVEIRVFWQRSLLEVIDWRASRDFYIGDGSREAVDFVMPDADARTSLIGFVNGRPVVRVPPGASARRRDHGVHADRAGAMRAVTSALADVLVLDDKTSIDVEIGAMSFSIRLGQSEAPCPRTLVGDGDARPLAYFGIALALSSALVASLAFFTPPLGLTDDDALDNDKMYLIQQYLDASAEREREPDKTDATGTSGGVDAPASPASGDPGKIGKRDVTAQNHRASGTAPGAEFRPATSRAELLATARDFGVIGLLNSGLAAATQAAFEDPGVGAIAAAGGFFGNDIGEVGGNNGLALGGPGEGGGFRGNQIGLNSIGTCHGEECLGKSGWGTGGHMASLDHTPHAPTLRMGKTVVERGSLPADVIQRIVRQSFGRFRGCYEAGLRINPNLEGRVTARFVIARDGSVATVQSGGADLPDAGVVSCVLRAYQSLTFPSPKDGVVTVTYPLTFSPAT